MDDEDYGRRRAAAMSNHQPTRPVDKDKNEAELGVSIKKAVTPEETAPSESSSEYNHRESRHSAHHTHPSALVLQSKNTSEVSS